MKVWRVRNNINHVKTGNVSSIFTFKTHTISVKKKSDEYDIMIIPHDDNGKYFMGFGATLREAFIDIRNEILCNSKTTQENTL